MAKSRKKKLAAAAAPITAEVAGRVNDAVSAVTPEKQRKGLTFGRLIGLALVGGVGALVASESLRSKVLDILFGAEEEFQYTPPVTSTPAPAAGTTPPVGAA